MARRLLRFWWVVLGVFVVPSVWAAEPAPPAANQQQSSPEKAEPKRSDAEKKAEAAKAEAEKLAAAKIKDDEELYELQKLLADTLDQVERNYVKRVTRRQLVEAAIKGVLRELDPYSSYINPDELKQFQSSVESEFGGIGIQITLDNGQLKVLSPLVDTPAYRAGLMAGDRILEIDGKSTEGLSIDEAVSRLKGEEDSQVTLKVLHPGETEAQARAVTLVRQRIRVETVMGDHRRTDDRWDFMLDNDRRIGYIRVSGFSRETANELEKALAELKKESLRGLVLDLRFNPGGLLPAAIEVCDLFVAKGRIVSTKGRNTDERVWEAREEGTFDGFPMAVLVNRFSASASEIVSACLQDHHRAVIVGERTWGKGSVQNVIPLEGNHSALKLTTAGYLRPNGKNIHRFPDSKEQDEWGVVPDKGFELKMADTDLVALMEDRRNRDILPAKPTVKPAQVSSVKPAEASPAAAAAAPKFADRQLRMAVDYLVGATAKAP